ncbi:MAG: hypothetical protein CVV44_06295 [Spirochaetae bacterium HGW-Spirochaetae-1]|jgi:hypothetical protein|nr:MAG: hypothetical protein CVV44_06295 [Spirochaetae bacterium HGW-Spirochaetae-1]
MNRIKSFIIAAGFLLLIPTASFAIVDVGAYGGYAFGTEIEGTNVDPAGFEYGLDAHLNVTYLVILKLGVGAFYQGSVLKYGSSSDYDKKIIGLDIYNQVDIPLFPIDPYVKFNTAIWEKVDTSSSYNSTEFFKAYSIGGGLLFTILPLPVMKVQLFGEYLYSIAKQDGQKATGHAVHLGLRLDI